MPRSFGTSLLAYKPFLQGRKENHMAFKPQTLDFEKSPYTGLVRESWIEAGKYLLDGIFQNIARFEDPVVLPRKETEITYPHKDASPDALETEKSGDV